MPGSADPAPALARDCARQIVDAFAHYNAEFRAITRRAPLRFDARDWRGSQQDAIERIGLYDRFVNQTIAELQLRLGAQAPDRDLWRPTHGPFAAAVTEQAESGVPQTPFSSLHPSTDRAAAAAPCH